MHHYFLVFLCYHQHTFPTRAQSNFFVYTTFYTRKKSHTKHTDYLSRAKNRTRRINLSFLPSAMLIIEYLLQKYFNSRPQVKGQALSATYLELQTLVIRTQTAPCEYADNEHARTNNDLQVEISKHYYLRFYKLANVLAISK